MSDDGYILVDNDGTIMAFPTSRDLPGHELVLLFVFKAK